MNGLNPNAEPFVPARAAQQRAAADVDERSLFMTFSNGSPVTRREILEHFTSSEYGEWVEDVYVHERHNRDPEFGKIIFTTMDLPGMILQNREVIKITVNGWPVWLKKYVPQNQRNRQNSL